MERQMTRFSRCAFVLALAIFAGRPATVRAQDKVGQWMIDYHTKAVTVLAVNHRAGSVGAELFGFNVENSSGRPITALSFRVGSNRGRAIHPFQPALEPGATGFCEFSRPAGEESSVHIVAVLFADGEAAADGDSAEVEFMRFQRLGEVLEGASCEAIFNGLDPTHLDDASLNGAISSADQSTRSLETILASFPDSPLKRKLQGASVAATGAFLAGVQDSSRACRWTLEQLLQQPGSSRTRSLLELRTPQPDQHLFQTSVEVDMGVAK
ncbi:MAG: hypothetical protein ACLQPN_05205 [Bryobacteraceae bacterium]